MHDRTASILLATLPKKLGFVHIFCRGTYLKFLLGIEFPEPCAAAFDGKSQTFLRLFWSVPMCRNCITELNSLRCYIAYALVRSVLLYNCQAKGKTNNIWSHERMNDAGFFNSETSDRSPCALEIIVVFELNQLVWTEAAYYRSTQVKGLVTPYN